ncbi:unnamed protein product, partial [Mesorhabditis spiculigera]
MFLRSMGPRRQLTNDPRDQHPPDQPPPPMETTARPFNIVAFLPTVIQYGMPLISLVFYVLCYLELRQQSVQPRPKFHLLPRHESYRTHRSTVHAAVL